VGAAAVEVRDVSHRYGVKGGSLTVLEGITFTIPAGGYASLTGRSGAGKSTLLAVLGGLESPQSGHVRVNGVELGGLSGDALAAYRRTTVGFVFQHFGLLDTLTARENVELSGTLDGTRRSRRRQRAEELLAAVGLSDRLEHRPGQLSGGERQRVAIARALTNDPALVLADEPTGNLDGEASQHVIELIESLRIERGCTLVLVTHDPALASRAEMHVRLDAGRLVA
jgi:putative ABC transport system ATP-binding protein